MTDDGVNATAAQWDTNLLHEARSQIMVVRTVVGGLLEAIQDDPVPDQPGLAPYRSARYHRLSVMMDAQPLTAWYIALDCPGTLESADGFIVDLRGDVNVQSLGIFAAEKVLFEVAYDVARYDQRRIIHELLDIPEDQYARLIRLASGIYETEAELDKTLQEMLRTYEGTDQFAAMTAHFRTAREQAVAEKARREQGVYDLTPGMLREFANALGA